MVIYSGFTHKKIKIVIFHSYVNLPEDNWHQMLLPLIPNSWQVPIFARKRALDDIVVDQGQFNTEKLMSLQGQGALDSIGFHWIPLDSFGSQGAIYSDLMGFYSGLMGFIVV